MNTGIDRRFRFFYLTSGGLSNQVQQFFFQGLKRRFPVETFPRAVIEQVNCMIEMFLRHRQKARVLRKELT
jgi:hypothetical protein